MPPMIPSWPRTLGQFVVRRATDPDTVATFWAVNGRTRGGKRKGDETRGLERGTEALKRLCIGRWNGFAASLVTSGRIMTPSIECGALGRGVFRPSHKPQKFRVFPVGIVTIREQSQHLHQRITSSAPTFVLSFKMPKCKSPINQNQIFFTYSKSLCSLEARKSSPRHPRTLRRPQSCRPQALR